MKIIGLISDTHGFIDPAIYTYFENCDEIWHAGDIGECPEFKELREFKTFRAVFGNIDTHERQYLYPENVICEIEGLKFLITHIAGSPPKLSARVKKIIKENQIAVLICGHSHIVKVVKDPLVVYINPGAAGKQGFHHQRTIMRMHVENKKIVNLELIDLGKR